jgi:hypothetical protein
MTRLYSRIRMKISDDEEKEENGRSLLIGEIMWNISQIKTEMSLVIGHALGMEPEDCLESIRVLNLDAKIRVLEANTSRIQLKFGSGIGRKAHFKQLRKLRDVRNTLAHGVIFSDAKGLYMNIPNRGSFKRNSLSLSVEVTDLKKILLETMSVAVGYRLGRAAAESARLKSTVRAGLIE